MTKRQLTLPELILIAVTRGMLGFGAGLLAAEQFGRDRRKTVGVALVAVGALSTIPLAMRVLRRRTNHYSPGEVASSAH